MVLSQAVAETWISSTGFVSQNPGPWPPIWIGGDIGGSVPAGNAQTDYQGVYTITGGGTDIGGTSDQFFFSYQNAPSDEYEISIRIDGQASKPDAKVGLMVRADLSADAAFVSIVVTPANGVKVQNRPTKSTTATVTVVNATTSYPVYLKLKGKTSTGKVETFYSPDGSTWTAGPVFSITIPTPPPKVGVVVTSTDTTATSTGTTGPPAVTPLAPSGDGSVDWDAPQEPVDDENTVLPDGRPKYREHTTFVYGPNGFQYSISQVIPVKPDSSTI